jgi:hypothetical protein
MTRKPKTTSQMAISDSATSKSATSKSATSKSSTSKTSVEEKPANRRLAAKPPAPDADEAGEFSSPACSAHEVDPAYMLAPSEPVASASQEKPKSEPPSAAASDADKPASKASPAKPSRVPFNQGPKPSWADRHTKSPHTQGRGRMRVGRPHGRGQGG